MITELRETRSVGDLLSDYRANGCDQPFEEVMRRYAGMVFNVCYRVTRNTHDAEDATQAVFLALAAQLKAGAEIQYIGAWLQQVAHRLSLDIRRGKKRRSTREQAHNEMAVSRSRDGNGQVATADLEDLKEVVAEELKKLPAKYRLPLVLHFFGGMSREEMAKELGCKPSTLGVRLHRAKAMLGKHLSGRGIDLTAAALTLTLGQVIRSVVTDSIVAHATRAAAMLGTSHEGGGWVPPAARLTRAATLATKAKVAVGLAVVAGTALTAAGRQAFGLVNVNALRQRLPDALDSAIQALQRPMLRSFVPRLQASAGSSGRPSAGVPATDTPNLSTRDLVAVALPIQTESLPPADAQVRRASSAKVRTLSPPADPAHVAAPPGSQGPAVAFAPSFGTTRDLPPTNRPADNAGDGSALLIAPATPHPARVAGASPTGGSAVASANTPLPKSASQDLYVGDGPGGGVPSSGALAGTFTSDAAPAPVNRYALASGYLWSRAEHIGYSGRGTFAQTGGTNAADAVLLGESAGGHGTYSLTGGTLQIRADRAKRQGVQPVLEVGGAGTGVLKLGDAKGAGTVREVPQGAGVPLVVGADAGGTGTVRGYGSVRLTGPIVQNGQVIADGYGSDRTLDLSTLGTADASVDAVTHTVPNTAAGTAGWFAVDGGKLTLPALSVAGGGGLTPGATPLPPPRPT